MDSRAESGRSSMFPHLTTTAYLLDVIRENPFTNAAKATVISNCAGSVKTAINLLLVKLYEFCFSLSLCYSVFGIIRITLPLSCSHISRARITYCKILIAAS